jgi:fructose-1,6-bisphosphatase/inositol monophosphatase family enzyme
VTSPGHPDAELAAELVTGAGQIAADWFRRPMPTDTKSNPTDYVTAADREAEAFVVERLACLRPDDGVLGEEGASSAGTSGRRWVIDPLDGTHNFVRGIDWWCSALALVGPEGVEVGAVRDPLRGHTYVGGPGWGAYADGVPIEPLVDRPLSAACAATYLHPPHFDTAVGHAWQRVVAGLGTYRLFGSGTMEAVLIAQGRLDLFLHHSVPAWDRLPGEALIRSVGGDTRTVEAAGVRWYVAGAPTAVAEACERLAGG